MSQNWIVTRGWIELVKDEKFICTVVHISYMLNRII